MIKISNKARIRITTPAVLFVMSFAFDFRGAQGGTLIQYAMAFVNTLSFVWLLLLYRMKFPKTGATAFLCWGWGGFLFVGSVGAWVNDVPLGQYIRTIYPYMLFLEGLLVALWLSRSRQGAVILTRAMLVTAFISLIFTLWWGFYFSGVPISTIRYQILSVLTPFIIAISAADLLLIRRHRIRSLVLFLLACSIAALSVTRGVVLEIGITLIVVLMASVRGSMRQRLVWPRKFFVAMIGSATTVVVIISTFVIFAPWILQRWLQRSQGNVGFATFWTRVAAVFGQWEQLVHNPIGWITGQGFGHVYQYSQAFAVYVYPYVSWSSFSQTMWYPGEFMWVTPLYYAGFVAGSIAILVLLYGFLCAFRTLVALTMGSRNTNLWWPLWVGSLGYLSTLTLGFTSDPFGSRLAGMFLGLSLGLVIVLRNNKNIAQKYQNTGTSGRSAIDKSTAYIK